ncbi:uncharacterized protein [Diabrotica undecimpunctata]|uniref:uncharacterized protein n=1 Tax=Diabrotica undecimpunctata TaxID=50387 RepID=UPI003B63E908
MTETKKKGNGTEKMEEVIHCWSGIDKKERAKAGIAIILKKKWEHAIENWEPINERIAKLNLKVYGRQIILLAVYGPTEDSSIAEKEQFIEQLQEEIEKRNKNQEIIIAVPVANYVHLIPESSAVAK